MPGRRFGFGRAILWGALLGSVAAIATEAGAVYLGRNWHAIVPGQAYRCAQLPPEQLIADIQRYGIRTVINLRGTSPDFGWYLNECRATRDADISQEDITLSAYRLPARHELRRLVEVLDRADRPILLHCRQGVDRTGLAAALFLLLNSDATLDEARKQLGFRYGHVSIGPTRNMLQFFELYDDWLKDRGLSHCPELLREFADVAYCPGNASGRLELVEMPAKIRAGTSPAIRIRATNTSEADWQFHPGTETGIHVRFMVFDFTGKLLQIGRAGQLEATIAPGQSIELTMGLIRLEKPGRYWINADLLDRNRYSFSQLGSDPLEFELQVTDQ